MSVENARVVDLVAHNPKTDQVGLVIFEHRPWNSSHERLLQLQDKIHSYVSYALDGQQTYPQLVGKPLTIVLSCFAQPDDVVTKKTWLRRCAAVSALDVGC
jgi:hypothetical protein